jgi:hypothetical protein
MNFSKFLFGICLFIFFALPEKAAAWGFFAHKQINRLAVFSLPEEMFGFYKRNIEYLSEHAVDPDKRRYLMEGEDVKHYIDIDHFEKVLPIDTIPMKYKDAIEKLGKDTIHAYGIVPWNIQWMMRKLTTAFEQHDVGRVLKLSAELGHYVGDAHVPLHTTENYNGQLSGQHGIHGFFESRLPELFFDTYSFFVGKANYIENPLASAWQAVSGSFFYVPMVFATERLVQTETPEDQKFGYEQKNNSSQKVYSKRISTAYHQKLEGIVEQRMQAAVMAVASYWYTAWVDAGQPKIDQWNLLETPLFLQDSIEIAPVKPVLGREE